MVGSAAACHLRTMILLKMRMHHQWYHDLFNRWASDLNTLADKNVYPELIGGEAWFGKIADTLAQWHLNPHTRYDFIRKWEYFLKDAMSYKSLDRSVVKTRDLIIAGEAYDEFKDPFTQIARHLLADANSYELKGGISCPHPEILSAKIPEL